MDIEIEVQEGEHLHNQEHNALEVAVVVPNNENVGKEYNDDGEIMQRPEKTIDVDSPASFVEPLTLVERGYTNVPTIDMRTIKDKEIDRNCEDASTKNIHKRRETAQSSRFNSNPPPKSDSAPHLVMLSEAGDVHRVQKLLSDGADIDEKNNNGCTALMAAVKIGSIEIVTILLDKGADVNLNAENGYTALMYASYYYFGSTRIAQLLIDGGADVNSTEVNGWTSLMIASQKGHLDFVKLLIDKKAAINETNCKGDTALMFSASNGHLDIAQRLIYNGALINVKNKVGDTALKFAAEKGHKKLVQLFLKEKIDVDEVSTAKEIALQNNHTAVYDLIENFICPEVRNRITARL
ncbi:unnamed protein product [Lymnaea stagnalis]|uniref:Uncharacterized protein n=1 Tax=Lymnaea stagnalis TaxID=6523 RepID=A0AAV2HG84_LYMST